MEQDDNFLRFGFMKTYFFDELTTITKDYKEGLNVITSLRTFHKDKNGDLIEKTIRTDSSEKEVSNKTTVWKRVI